MEFVIEKDISEDTIFQVYQIALDYTRDYFTRNYPEELRADMRFQRAITLRAGAEITSAIVFTCLDGSPHITMMATKRSWKGKGCGKLLMERFVEHVSLLGFRSIELYTFSPATNPAYAETVGFYESAGFRTIREYPELWEPDTVTLKMRKSW